MNLKTLFVSTVVSLASLASSASAQWGGTSVGVGFGGSYSRTSISGPYGGNTTITNTSLGGGIGVGYNSGYYGGGYGGGYYGGVPAPAVLPYYGGCAPAYVPYSPFTGCYGNPYYAPAVVVAPVVYGGGCGQAWVR